MKIQIGKTVLCTRNRLKKKLIEAKKEGADESRTKWYYYIVGCYDSHWFGLCLYRNNIDV